MWYVMDCLIGQIQNDQFHLYTRPIPRPLMLLSWAIYMYVPTLYWMGYPWCNLPIQTLNVRTGDLTKNFQAGCILRLIWFWHDCKIEFSTTNNDCKTSLGEQKGWDKGEVGAWVYPKGETAQLCLGLAMKSPQSELGGLFLLFYTCTVRVTMG